jgi:transcriptional regulator with XRE-family HTH domain
MIADGTSDVNAVIAARVRELRSLHGLSLETLAARCGVSRSMISVIERAEASATAVVLERLATGLQVPLASPLKIIEVAFPPRARVAYETAAHEPPIHQQIWVLEGSIDVTLGYAVVIATAAPRST